MKMFVLFLASYDFRVLSRVDKVVFCEWEGNSESCNLVLPKRMFFFSMPGSQSAS